MTRKHLLVLAAVLAVVAALSFAARAFIIEPRDAAHLCAAADTLCVDRSVPWWCGLRGLLVTYVFPWSGFGWVSLGLGILGLILGRRVPAAGALLVGLPGLVLYDADMAAVGVVLGLWVVSRPPEAPSAWATDPARP